MQASVCGLPEFHLHVETVAEGIPATGSVLVRQFALSEVLGGGHGGAKRDTEPVGNDTGCDAP